MNLLYRSFAEQAFVCYGTYMESFTEIAVASWRVFQQAALYVLFGFLVAGILRVYLRAESVAYFFRRGRIKSVVYAALLGIPIPL